MESVVILFSFLGLVAGNAIFDHPKSTSDNQLLFTSIGETTRESGYAHLVIPLPIPQLEDTVNVLQDLVKTHNEYALSATNLYKKTEQYGIDRLQSKINLILSLAQRGGFVAKELQLDDVNLLKEKLKQLSARRRRSVMAATAALLGVASFGTSIFNNAQISRLNEDRKRIAEQQHFMMEELEEHNLRIDNVTTFVQNQYTAWVKQVGALAAGQKKTVMVEMDHQIHLLIQAFRMELTDFLTGITMLMENRLSPLLLKTGSVTEAFQKLTGLARSKNMHPLSEDAGILFQVSTSTIVDDRGQLYAIVHLPLYAGNTLKLYRYVPAPFLLDDSKVIVEINSRAEYLALDTHGMIGRQMTVSEFQLCRKTGSMYHCPHMNLLSKNMKTLCLYNLFNQVPEDIERTCDVQVSLIRSHAVQISTSLYRILAAKPTQLIMDCRLGSNLTTIHGVHMLRLTEECPKASTPEYLFVRTPELVGYHELINLPLLTRSREWLGEVVRELDITEVMESINEVSEDRSSIPLRKFRNQIQKGHLKMYKTVESYVTSTVIYGVILIVFCVIIWYFYVYFRNCCRARRRSVQTTLANDVNTEGLDGALIRRPNVTLPLSVRRQFEVM